MATNGLEIKVGADVGDAIKGLESLSDAAKSTSLTWREFVGQRMGQYMKDLGGHGPAIKKIAEEWSAYKESLRGVAAATANIPTATAKLIPPINAVGDQLKKIPGSTNQASSALMNFGRIVQDAPFGIMGVANNIDPLLESFIRLKESTGSTGAAFKALLGTLAGPAGIAIAVSTVTSALIAFGPEIKAALSSTGEFSAAIKEAAEGSAVSAIKINILVNALNSGTLSISQTAKAQEQLIKLSPEFKSAFTDGATSAYTLDAALQKVTASLLNQIKIQGATSLLQKEFEKLVETIANGGELTTFQTIKRNIIGAFNPVKGVVNEVTTAYQNVNEAQIKVAQFSDRINQVFNALGITYGAFVENQDKVTKSTVKYAQANKELSNVLNVLEKIGLGFETRSQREIAALEEKIRRQEEFNRLSKEVLQNVPKRQPGSQLQERLSDNDLAGLKGLDKVNEKLQATKDLIYNGLSSGIDQFFNAIANNKDPFAALAQSAKRLVAELGAAVVKALLLKAISTALGVPGADSAVKGLGSLIGGRGVIRGDQMQLLTFLRG